MHKLNPRFQAAEAYASTIPMLNPTAKREAIRRLLAMLKKAIG